MTRDLSHARELTEQATAFREAVSRAEPTTAVPTCPGWDVCKLTRHLARVYAMVNLALTSAPGAQRPAPPRAPEEFTEALAWWDEQLEALRTAIGTDDLERPVWSFFRSGTPRSWARRMAHETAMHRLDAEHARVGTHTGHSQELLFDPLFAADGIDEYLTVLLDSSQPWHEHQQEGHVLFHAADAGKAWLVTLRPQREPEVGTPQDAALGKPEVDATVAGTADAVYRQVWGRPSSASITGEHGLAELMMGR